MRRLRYLLDTDTCIYVKKYHPPEVRAHLEALKPGEVGMSVITYGELCYGAARSQHPAQALHTLSRLTHLIPVLPMAAAAGEYYGVIRDALTRSGTIIGNNDLWIAAHALALNVTLVSNNMREFGRVERLHLDNWLIQTPGPG